MLQASTTTIQEQCCYDVAIVGSGPAGLVSAKTLLEEGIDNIIVFDETSSAGGLWNQECGPSRRLDVPCIIRNDNDDNDNDNNNSSNNSNNIVLQIPASSQPVYDNLVSNFPKDMTSFQGYPFPSHIECFPKANTIATYFQRYSQHYQIDKITHYNTRVTKCYKNHDDFNDDNDAVWTIETIDSQTGQTNKKWHSKRLLVCNGHFRKAYAPYVTGIEHFKGRILHSSAFSSPSSFQNKTVLIIGGGISGADIAKMILEQNSNTKVVISVRDWKPPQDFLLPRLQRTKGLLVWPAIDYIDRDGSVQFLSPPSKNRKKERTKSKYSSMSQSDRFYPDIILFATGYRYYFPFLNDKMFRIVTSGDGFKMEGLYKRILSLSDPSLAFIGITNVNFSPAIVMEYQAKWYVQRVVKENLRCIDKSSMMEEVESRKHDRTQDALALKFPAYCNSLAKDIDIQGYWMQLMSYRFPLFLRTLCATTPSQKLFLMGGVVLSPLLGYGILKLLVDGGRKNLSITVRN